MFLSVRWAGLGWTKGNLVMIEARPDGKNKWPPAEYFLELGQPARGRPEAKCFFRPVLRSVFPVRTVQTVSYKTPRADVSHHQVSLARPTESTLGGSTTAPRARSTVPVVCPPQKWRSPPTTSLCAWSHVRRYSLFLASRLPSLCEVRGSSLVPST